MAQVYNENHHAKQKKILSDFRRFWVKEPKKKKKGTPYTSVVARVLGHLQGHIICIPMRATIELSRHTLFWLFDRVIKVYPFLAV